jgi:hypothetical protein
MPLANYTTTVSAQRTVAEIQEILAKHGAREILVNYSDDGVVESLAFIVLTPYGKMPIRLPVNPQAILKVLEKQRVPRSLQTHEQAVKIAWRILRDWIRAQMAILETEMVRMEQIFLPYMIAKDNKTLYEAMVDHKFYLPQG